MRACDVIKPEIIERLLNQLLLKQRTQKPVINAMMAADQEYLSLIHISVETARDNLEEGGDDVKSSCPL